MSECVSDGTKIALYADDTKIWRKIETWNDYVSLQNDIDALYAWSVANKMRFHPQKCKVLALSRGYSIENLWSEFPFSTFFYHLNGTELDYSDNENDLGVIINTKMNWSENVHVLCLKASSRLGLTKRTLHFIKDIKQKRTFYLALVRSIFEHCSVIWRPSSLDMLQKIESIQKKAVKWILSEIYHHYNDYEYLKRLKDLDLMPMEYKFKYTDLIQFHQIYYGKSVVRLPSYLTPVTENDHTRLRANINRPGYYSEGNTPGAPDLGSMRRNRYDRLSLKSSIEAKAPAFKNGFFFRTHLLWNDLPVKIREFNDKNEFQTQLKDHLWDVLLDPD